MKLITIYINLQGRLSLKGYWIYWNIPFILTIFTLYLLKNRGYEISPKILSAINLIILWPIIATSVKRLHDLNKSGWWFLLHLFPFIGSMILSIFLWFVPGTKGANQYD